MKSKRIIPVFFILILILWPVMPFVESAGYGEENENLGQFTDDFENANNVSVAVNVINNQTLNCIELKLKTGLNYSGFSNGIEIVIDHDRINENLTDFPIFLNVSDNVGIGNDDVSPIFDEIGDSYLKIAITNQAQDVEYYVDVEYWDSTEELGYIWIGPVNISSLENTTLRFFYDSSEANNTAYIGASGSIAAQGVWDSYFLCVLHLSESSGNFLDSTSNNNDASAQGTVNRGTQLIDGGIDLPGTNDYVRIDTAGILDGLDEATIETWVNIDAMGADRSLISDWGVEEDILIFYAQTSSNRYRFIWRNVGNVDPNVVFGSVNVNNWEYIATKYVRNDFAYGYENGVESVSGASGNTALTSPNNLLFVGIDRDFGRDLNGKMDEVRISSTGRSQPWINASYISMLDNLVDWMQFSSSGYELEGYFTTEDYLNYTTGQGLVLLTNASIPFETSLTVQFSNDNATWVDNEGNVGSTPVLDGFYAIDLRDLNYTDSFKMYNLTTTDVTITPRLYQSRLVTTNGTAGVGPVGPGPTVIQNVTGEWVYYNLTTINVTVGTLDSGDLNSTLDIDGDTYDCSEVVGAPGYVIEFEWTDVDLDAHCLWVTAYIFYDGVSAHTINVDLWNFTAPAWVTIGIIYDMVDFEWVNSSIYDLRMPNDFINSTGAVRGRFYHASAGNINDDIHTDFLKLYAFIPFEDGIDGEIVTEQNFFWIFIAITLSMIVGIVVWLKYEHNDN